MPQSATAVASPLPEFMFQIPAPQNLNPTPGAQAHVLPFPGPTAPPRLGLSDPKLMVVPDTPYNLLDDIAVAQRAAMVGKEKISLYGFPAYVSVNIRRVLARGKRGRVDWSVALSCLLWRGITRYSQMPAVRALGEGLQDLDTDDGLPAIAAEQVELWRRGFKFAISDPTHTMGMEARRSWRCPEHVYVELVELSTRIGIGRSQMGTVCVMVALEDQDGVLREHGEFMRGVVGELDRILGDRERRLRGLARAVRAGVYS